MSALALHEYSRRVRPGIELGFRHGHPVVYDGTEPVAIDAQAGKGKLARFLGVNLVSPRTAHLTKIITDPKDGLGVVEDTGAPRLARPLHQSRQSLRLPFRELQPQHAPARDRRAACASFAGLGSGLRCGVLSRSRRSEPVPQMDRPRSSHQFRPLQQDRRAASVRALAVQCRRAMGFLRT